MAVKIGSARSDERGKITGGKPGDQKGGKEVMTQDWYLHKKGWVIIRIRDAEKREKAAYAMQAACDNQHFGYSQTTRITGYNAAKEVGFDPAKVKEDVNVDCSELVRLCLAYAGIFVPNWYTGSMVSICRKMKDDFEIITDEAKTKVDDYLLRGDILVTKTKGHTVIVLSDGAKAKDEKAGACYPDISHHHPVTNWAAVEKTAKLIIMKATQGTTFIDGMMPEVITECEKRKIPYWLYVYLDKGDELAQTKKMVEVCKNRVGKYFVGYVLDIEAKNNQSDVKAALVWLKKQWPKCMIYTMYSQYQTYRNLITDRGENVAWWEARYGKNDGTYNSKYPAHSGVDLHQYTSAGRCAGITGKIDLNRLTGTKDLSWFTTPPIAQKVPTGDLKLSYGGAFPSLANGRGWYQRGDGITTLKNYPTQIKRIQTLVNWIADTSIVVDGRFGAKTEEAVKKAQEAIGVGKTGIFDSRTLTAAKLFKK